MANGSNFEKRREDWEKALEKSGERRARKKRRRMKVSGRGVLKLKEIMGRKR